MTERQKKMKEFVVYVVCVSSHTCKADNAKQAQEWATKKVMDRLKDVDNNVYVPKVAVMEKGLDEEAKQHLASLEAPWLSEGSGIDALPKLQPHEDEEKPS